MWQAQDLLVEAGHPSAAGHFPGNPIVPGALLLDAAVAAIAGGQGGVIIRNVKFLRPVRHGEALQLRWREGVGEYRFECRLAIDGSVAMAGTLALGAAP